MGTNSLPVYFPLKSMGLHALQPRVSPVGPCLRAVPATAWTLRMSTKRRNAVACLMPSKCEAFPVSSSGLGLSIP